MMWGSLWDSVREAELAPQNYVELVIKNINVETDESTIQTLLGRVSTAMNYYLSDKQREELVTQIEAVLIDKMQNAPTLGQRITFNRAFLNVASSEKARLILKDTLGGKYQIKDLKLKTRDKFDIVTRLLMLGDKDAWQLLAELEKTETTDEAKRYAYAARSGIGTAENKAKFWNDFVGNKELSESWIESAFVAFNAPRHSELTLPYLEKALTELPNLKRNRKIFFVNGWLMAFVGGQRSEQSLAVINKFLADNPNLDKDLRLKILENADGLERAVKIRQKFSAEK
jgi:aminopeptidase N